MSGGGVQMIMEQGKPRVGIPVPTSADREYNGRSWPQYAAAVSAAGGFPVQVALGLSSVGIRKLIETCAGFVLPGSPADVDPTAYGQEPDPATAAPDFLRQVCDRSILEHVEASGRPVLAICFGLQFLNVWRGGTLVQDLHPVPVNHGAGASVAVAHSVLVSSESLMAGLLTRSEAPASDGFRKLAVNSSHHQAIAAPGDGLSIVARSSEDAVIEALEGLLGQAPVIGIQWHPERSTEISAGSRALFAWLVMAATDWAENTGELAGADAF